ncbi:MAG TPA: M56 family metallopeptidase [Rhizomicrobium sp.]|jgi:beta-lactamase regulating signal transducer with metallopeptidase domain
MSTFAALHVLLLAGEAFAATSLIMGIAWLAAARKTASARHVAWAGGFAGLLLFPMLAALMPSQFHISVAAPSALPLTETAVTATVAPAAPAGFSLDAGILAEVAVALWLIGILYIAGRAAMAAFVLHRLRVKSVVHRFGHLPIDGPACSLRISTIDSGRGPMTWGLLHPVILLPKESRAWSRERLVTVLRHELAHVARRDSFTQALALIGCALYWPNPLVWLGAQALRREAEMAADDAVLISGVRPSTYASELLQIARDCRNRSTVLLPVAMAAPSALEARVKSVLAPTQSRSGVTTMDVFRIACWSLVATAVIAFARPSLAQEPAPLQKPRAVTLADNAMPAAPAVSAASADDAVSPDQPVAPEEAQPPRHSHRHHHAIIVDDDGHVRVDADLTPEDRRQIHEAIQKAHAAVEAARPQIEKAIHDAHIAEKVEAAIKANQPQIDAAIAEARRASKPMIREALAEARVEIERERAKGDVELQRALDKAQAQLDRESEKLDRDTDRIDHAQDAAPGDQNDDRDN